MVDIFLDMDGVLADLKYRMYWSWIEHGNDAFDEDYPDYYLNRTTAISPYAKFEAWLDRPYLWNSGPVIDVSFWSRMPGYTWTDQLVNELKGFTVGRKGSLQICTNPGRPVFAASASVGKQMWCQQRLPRPLSVILIERKYLLAAPNRVLIDDTDRIINEWRQAGGIGILFPQPWNTAWPLITPDPVSYCMDELKKAFS